MEARRHVCIFTAASHFADSCLLRWPGRDWVVLPESVRKHRGAPSLLFCLCVRASFKDNLCALLNDRSASHRPGSQEKAGTPVVMKEAGDPLSMQVLSVASWGNAHIRYRSSSQSNRNRHIDVCCVYQGSTFGTTITCGSSAIIMRGVNGQGGHILIVTSVSINAHHSPPIRQPPYPTGSYVAPVKAGRICAHAQGGRRQGHHQPSVRECAAGERGPTGLRPW